MRNLGRSGDFGTSGRELRFLEAAKRKPWRVSVWTYLGGRPLVEIDSKHADLICDAERKIRKFRTDLFSEGDATESVIEVPDPWRRDLAFFLREGEGPVADLLCLERTTSRILGGASRGLPWVVPEARGSGIGSEIVFLSDIGGHSILQPGSYSEAGLRGRLGAHRRHVERALALWPDDVPDEVRSEYALSASGLVLAAPITPEVYARIACRWNAA